MTAPSWSKNHPLHWLSRAEKGDTNATVQWVYDRKMICKMPGYGIPGLLPKAAILLGKRL
jgi:hypothetical protein